LSDREGERRLRDPRELDNLGRAIATGIRRYLGPSTAAAPAFPATALDVFIHPVMTRIFELIDASGLVDFEWADRGKAPIG
jgi:hypothetical protein